MGNAQVANTKQAITDSLPPTYWGGAVKTDCRQLPTENRSFVCSSHHCNYISVQPAQVWKQPGRAAEPQASFPPPPPFASFAPTPELQHFSCNQLWITDILSTWMRSRMYVKLGGHGGENRELLRGNKSRKEKGERGR